jgi:short-subunit dehydrogenase involved in D-alanine esterification of teichoic acids
LRKELILGGGTGIGLMQTLALAQNGAKVYITSRNADKLNHVAEQYKSSGDIVPVVGDITSKDGIAKIVEQIQKDSPNGINILYVLYNSRNSKLMAGSTMLVLLEKDLERDMRSRMMLRSSVSNC